MTEGEIIGAMDDGLTYNHLVIQEARLLQSKPAKAVIRITLPKVRE